MKKFAFALDKVLDYKGQVENSLRSEYAQKMAKVKKTGGIHRQPDFTVRRLQERIRGEKEAGLYG